MYSLDFRKAVLLLYENFQSMRKVSQVLKISIASISRWCKRLEYQKRPNKPRKFSDNCRMFVKSLLLTNPLLTSFEIVLQIKEFFNIIVSRQLINVIIKSVGFTRKRCKIRTSPVQPSETVKNNFLEKVNNAFENKRKDGRST